MFQRTLEQVQHFKAGAAGVLTVGSGFTVLLGNVDSVLRVLLTLVGVISGTYAALYYRLLWKEKRARK